MYFFKFTERYILQSVDLKFKTRFFSFFRNFPPNMMATTPKYEVYVKSMALKLRLLIVLFEEFGLIN